MPYITYEQREELRSRDARTQGELNYQITVLMLKYIRDFGQSYDNISNAIAAGIDAAEELSRRQLAPYEDNKIKENGDIYASILSRFTVLAP